ncbi:MAG: DUF2157 domain-containing protein [Gemmatimonadales bacterium]|nr:DUF2157 domain-containing protein [Gemmatimonadales bacterium]
MSAEPRAVLAAIDRWEQDGIVDAETGARLRAETTHEAGKFSRRMSQYLLATTGGVVLVIAAGVFLEWSWPQMSEAVRSGVLAVIGISVVAIGARLELLRRWIPASFLLQAGGLGVVLAAMIYSGEAWPDETVGAIAFAVMSLAMPIVVGIRGMRTNVVTPAVGFAFGLVSIAFFLMRATPLDSDGVVWATDVVFLVAVLGLLRVLATDPTGEKRPWALYSFITGLLAGFVLVIATASGPLDLGDEALYPLDLWLGVVATLALWGLHKGPAHVRDAGLERILAVLMLFWIPLGFGTATQAIDGPPEVGLLLVGSAGVAGFLHADRHDLRTLMAVSALAFIAALWYWGVERGGALGAALALFATAGLLFWLSGRMRATASADSVEPAG